MSSQGPSTHLVVDTRSQTPPKQLNMADSRPGEARDQGRADTWPSGTDGGSSSQYKHPEGLLPAFSSTQYTHLPTPQSPSGVDRLVVSGPFPPESPIPSSSQSFNASTGSLQRLSQRSFVDEGNSRTPSHIQQVLTPDSSPFVSRTANSRQINFATPTNNYDTPHTSRINLESSILNTPPTLKPGSQTPSSPPEAPPPTSTLSSPFMAKATTSDRNKRTLSNPGPAQPQDIFSPAVNPGETQNPAATSQSAAALANFVLPGGEMERIRQAERENAIAFAREAEARRPDYLKRAKHDSSSSNAMDEDGERPVGIMETPMKGRRLKLFQETSEESFEESLMAGGYGRYRTADWVRQPQPISFPAGIAGASNIIQKLEAVEEVPEQPPTEKELKKRKRLEAFRSNRSEGSLRSKLYPVELEGKGRVLLDIPNEMPPVPPSPDPSPSKRRATRRKKKSVDVSSKDTNKRTALEQAASAFAGGEDPTAMTDNKPNWPDAEFPWRLRTEERAEAAKAEEEERLKWIERFLDAESDEEDEPAPPPSQSDSEDGGRSSHLSIEALPAPRMGRGKMVPLLSHPEDPRKAYQKKRTTFPTDPGDARAALLAKRSVRALSYRQMRRQREMNENDDEEPEELCICRGTDDGRELVQCDDCRTWYHLECIGIRDIRVLGREEDPWFCRRCVTRSRSPSSEPEVHLMSEPTFAPTDEAAPLRERSSDATLYHPSSLQDSPNWLAPATSRIPKTPTRGYGVGGGGHAHVGPLAAWPDFSSKHSAAAPTTPKSQNHPVKVHTQHTPGSYEGFRVIHEETTPFDPNSTPSRGLRFSRPFSTPKTNSLWSASTRPGGTGAGVGAGPLFHTPSRPTHNRGGVGNRSFGGPGSLSAALDDMGSKGDYYHYRDLGLQRGVEESPMRRTKSRDAAGGAAAARRGLQPYASMPVLEESPVMRNKGKERVVEGTTRLL